MLPGSTSGIIGARVKESSRGSRSGQGAQKLRLAFGVFEQSSKLPTALEALVNRDFIVPDFCVFGTIDALSRIGSILRKKSSLNMALLGLFIDVELCQVRMGSPRIVGSRSELLSIINRLIIRHRQADEDHESDDNCGISNEFIEHIDQGLLVLAVDVAEPRQLIHASKILLDYSPYSIQTHEFLITG